MKKILILSLLLILPTQFLSAQDLPSAAQYDQEVANNVSDEYASCVVYFYIVRRAVEGPSSTFETVSGYNTAAVTAMVYGPIPAG